jgi:transposase-like protein
LGGVRPRVGGVEGPVVLGVRDVTAEELRSVIGGNGPTTPRRNILPGNAYTRESKDAIVKSMIASREEAVAQGLQPKTYKQFAEEYDHGTTSLIKWEKDYWRRNPKIESDTSRMSDAASQSIPVQPVIRRGQNYPLEYRDQVIRAIEGDRQEAARRNLPAVSYEESAAKYNLNPSTLRNWESYYVKRYPVTARDASLSGSRGAPSPQANGPVNRGIDWILDKGHDEINAPSSAGDYPRSIDPVRYSEQRKIIEGNAMEELLGDPDPFTGTSYPVNWDDELTHGVQQAIGRGQLTEDQAAAHFDVSVFDIRQMTEESQFKFASYGKHSESLEQEILHKVFTEGTYQAEVARHLNIPSARVYETVSRFLADSDESWAVPHGGMYSAEKREQFWGALLSGDTLAEAARKVDIHKDTAKSWFVEYSQDFLEDTNSSD